MTALVLLGSDDLICFGSIDVILSGIAGLLVGLIVELLRLEFRERRERRQIEEHRRHQRLAIWGYD